VDLTGSRQNLATGIFGHVSSFICLKAGNFLSIWRAV